MVTAPLEQKLYIKGENLTKVYLYTIAYFYKMIDGPSMSVENIPYKRIIGDKLDMAVVKQTAEEVKALEDTSFMGLLSLIVKINPVRYKDIPSMYINYFYPSCGTSLIFALENLQYLFLLVSSASYKSNITGAGLNKLVAMSTKKANAIISSLGI